MFYMNQFKRSIDAFTEEINKLRENEHYPHECKAKNCQERGCGKLYVMDGLWKVRSYK